MRAIVLAFNFPILFGSGSEFSSDGGSLSRGSIAVVTGKCFDDFCVEGLPEWEMMIEVEEDGSGVVLAIDEELEVGEIWVLGEGYFPQVLVKD